MDISTNLNFFIQKLELTPGQKLGRAEPKQQFAVSASNSSKILALDPYEQTGGTGYVFVRNNLRRTKLRIPPLSNGS
ncbi:hypothetical protein [Altericista sp. CCNU0014]|uniref:hypothetical protein n=1 Tax=Altericista sp. CCNU0014 TaxID=3082949 RepID=UPI00384F396D